jgi:hypothetical protein
MLGWECKLGDGRVWDVINDSPADLFSGVGAVESTDENKDQQTTPRPCLSLTPELYRTPNTWLELECQKLSS